MNFSFLHTLPKSEKDDLLNLTTIQELPKPRYATNLAVTAYPTTRRSRKVVYSHIEVYKMVETVAGRMREAGVRPGTVCAFALPNSCEAIIYFYAIIWIAAIAAPIDPTLADDEFEAAVRKSGAKVLVSPLVDDGDDPLLVKCKNVAVQLDLLEWHIHRTTNEGVVLETHGRLMGSGAAWAGGAGDFKLDPEEVAVHVSSPIGVVPLSHFALCEAAKSFVSTYALSVGMSTMLAPPLHDIQGILILLATFFTGGHIILPGGEGFDATKFWEFAQKHSITWLSAYPLHLLELHEQIDKGIVTPTQQLTFVRSCDSVCITPEVVEKVEASLKTPVYESYGPAEAAGFATTNLPNKTRHGTFGMPVKGVQVGIFDFETKQPLPPGAPGDIAVCGLHVASKYVDEEGTDGAVTFYTETANGYTIKWHGTGDRGMIDTDGYVMVQGNSKKARAAEMERQAKELEAAALAKAEEEKLAREAEEEAARLEKEQRIAREAELAAAAALAAAKAAAAEEQARKLEEERKAEEKRKEEEEAARMAALIRAGVDNPHELDEETAMAILSRLEAIEENHRRLREDVEGRNAAEIEEMKRRIAVAEAEAERLKMSMSNNGQVVDLRMEDLEAAVLAAAASAETSANNTREAVKAAREVADATYGANHSQPVELKASTGDQGALTKTVKVPLDDVEKAMKSHPSVEHARAFGRKDKRFGAEVYCAIVPKRGARVSEAWLKLHAQSVLPAPMVPKKFYYMSKLPEDMTRRQLSESNLLQDLSEFSGCSEVKNISGPRWKPKSKRRVAS